ncbi:MAG TPA: hypothetical protein VGK84_12765 [Candidatus Tumulicola sp.]|jgi:hypothetical protein
MKFWKPSTSGFDFTPILLVLVALFVVVSVVQFTQGWAAGQHGLLLFEKACPIYSRP